MSDAASETAAVAAASTGGLTQEQWDSNSWGDDALDREQAKVDAFFEGGDEDDEPESDSIEALPDRWEDLGDDGERAQEKPQKAAKPKEPAKEAAPKEKAAPPQKDEPEKSPEPRTYKVKLGKDERELDAEKMSRALGVSPEVLATLDEQAAIRVYQKQWHAERVQDESRRAMQQMHATFEKIKANPIAGFQELAAHEQLGVDFRSLAQQYLAREIELQAMSPEQRELVKAKEELDRIKATRSRSEREERARQDREASARRSQELGAEIRGALASRGLPEHMRNQVRIFEMMREHQASQASTPEDMRDPRPRAQDLMDRFVSEMQSDIRTYLAGQPADKIAAALGEEIVKALEERAVKRFQRTTRRTEARVDADAPEPRRRKVKTYYDVENAF